MEQKKILIVDDNAAVADSFKEILELFGHQVQCVYDWKQVLSLVAIEQFSIIFMDLNLQDMSGITLLKHIKSSALTQCSHTKFIAVSGYSLQDKIGIEASNVFDFYIQKPISLESLETLLASLDSI